VNGVRHTWDRPACEPVASGRERPSSKDCCGKVGFIFGTCKDINITVLPADVND
jgi:hypothetical protein